MATPQEITVSLEWAMKSQQAGMPQEDALFYWVKTTNREEWILIDRATWSRWRAEDKSMKWRAAHTAEEIVRRLPIHSHPNDPANEILPRATVMMQWNQGHFDTLANASAAMWCFLAEQKLLP